MDQYKLYLCCALGVYLAFKSLSSIRNRVVWGQKQRGYESKIKQRLNHRQQNIARFIIDFQKPDLDVQARVLACKDVVEILKELDQKSFSCVQLMLTYIYKCIEDGLTLSLIADVNFQEAIELAMVRDSERKRGAQHGLLHGIPFSIKDFFDMKGFDTTNGCAA
jgi:fatty acid amide hydrolase